MTPQHTQGVMKCHAPTPPLHPSRSTSKLRTPSACCVATPAAKYLGISVPALDRITADGSGPREVPARRAQLGFRIVDLDKWLAGRVEAADPKSRKAA